MKPLTFFYLTISIFSVLSFRTASAQSTSEPIKESWNRLSNEFIRKANLVNNLVTEVTDSVQTKKMSVDKSLYYVSKDEKLCYAKLTKVLTNIQLPDSTILIRVENLNDSLNRLTGKFLSIINPHAEFKTYLSFKNFQVQIEGVENRINAEIHKFNDTCKNSPYVSLYYKSRNTQTDPEVKF